MNNRQEKYYPTILGAAHLVILYIFIQTIIDFPLAIWDYYHGTEFLYNPFKKIALGVGSFAFILFFAYRKAKTKISTLIPARWFNPLIFIPVILFLWAAHIFLAKINIAINEVIPPPVWFWELFNRVFESDYGIYGAFLKIVIIAPIFEEFIFRGIIMHGFMRNYPKIIAIFVSALFFALFHLNPWQFPATFLLGLLLGWVMVITRNIFACIIGHSINNLMVLLEIEYADRISEFSIYLIDEKSLLYLSYLVAGFSVVLIGILATLSKRKT
ncbi:lysostaphin resistance A-like protein [Sunxiuqinia sp. A32]|uniref:lysostaphin resistance A-like protein n=1 Tax=Sunxiuqinia sp. A32 TaxID=3461496 RepID=UPI004046852F